MDSIGLAILPDKYTLHKEAVTDGLGIKLKWGRPPQKILNEK